MLLRRPLRRNPLPSSLLQSARAAIACACPAHQAPRQVLPLRPLPGPAHPARPPSPRVDSPPSRPDLPDGDRTLLLRPSAAPPQPRAALRASDPTPTCVAALGRRNSRIRQHRLDPPPAHSLPHPPSIPTDRPRLSPASPTRSRGARPLREDGLALNSRSVRNLRPRIPLANASLPSPPPSRSDAGPACPRPPSAARRPIEKSPPSPCSSNPSLSGDYASNSVLGIRADRPPSRDEFSATSLATPSREKLGSST